MARFDIGSRGIPTGHGVAIEGEGGKVAPDGRPALRSAVDKTRIHIATGVRNVAACGGLSEVSRVAPSGSDNSIYAGYLG